MTTMRLCIAGCTKFTLFLLSCSLCTSCCRSEAVRTEMCAPPEHVLTWRTSEDLPDSKIQMVCFDGEALGEWKEAVAQLKEMALPPGTVVKVVRESELQPEESLLIDVRNGLVNDWVSSGVQLEYYIGGKKLEVHTLAWWGYDDDSMREAECPEDARYIFDNRYIGKGAQALAALKGMKIGKEAFGRGHSLTLPFHAAALSNRLSYSHCI